MADDGDEGGGKVKTVMSRAKIDALIQRVSSVSDREIRVRLLIEQCAGLDDEARGELGRELAVRAGMRDERAQQVLLAWTEADAEVASRRKGVIAAPEADWGTGRPLTLGERKTLARNSDRKLLERALRDAHPDVIAEVLRNPRVTELDVTRMCASPKARPEVLARVLATPKWAARTQVRSAIAQNPATPATLAISLVPMLDRAGLHEVAVNERLAPSVRARAIEVLRRLPPTPEPEPTHH